MAWNARHVWSVGEILTASSHNNNDADLDYVPRELDYVQITADITGITATTEGTAVAVITGNSVSYDGSRVRVEFWAPGYTNTGAANTVTIVLLRDTTVIGRCNFIPPSTNESTPMTLAGYDTPSNGSHTYKAKAFVAAGTGVVKAGAGGSGAELPAYLRVLVAKQ